MFAAKKLNFFGEKMGFGFWSKIRDSHFIQKYDFSFQFFYRSLVKSRRTLKEPNQGVQLKDRLF